VFRRRRREDADQSSAGYPAAADAEGAEDFEDSDEDWDEAGEPGEWDAAAVAEAEARAPGLSGGPWDANEAYPERERADFGSLLVPIVPTQQIELATDGQQFIWVTVKHGNSELRVHAFAAPKSGNLWRDVRQEIVSELASAGSASQDIEGPFGPEVFAYVPVDPANPAAGTRPVRFIGVDGPRWLLRGLIIGPAASGDEPPLPFEEILSDIVVVRGDHPMPPRDMLELRLPPEVQQALEEQAAAAQQAAEGEEAEPENRFQPDLNPFERGPEFTETR
jgi:Protein of unknown function (DUF3710)